MTYRSDGLARRSLLADQKITLPVLTEEYNEGRRWEIVQESWVWFNGPGMGTPPHSDGYARAVELTEEAMRVTDETHYEEGEKLLREAMELVPDEPHFLNNYIAFCLQVAQNCTLNDEPAEAIVYYRKALELGTDDAEGWMDLGAAYARNDQSLEALQAWQNALAMLNPGKGRDKENIQNILENVRTVQNALKDNEEG